MGKFITIDVRGLEAPEPMERVLDAVALLGPDDTLQMLIDREPRPLYRILQQNGYRFEAVVRDDGVFDILIRHAR